MFFFSSINGFIFLAGKYFEFFFLIVIKNNNNFDYFLFLPVMVDQAQYDSSRRASIISQAKTGDLFLKK